MRFGTPDEIVEAFSNPESRAKLVAEATPQMMLWAFLRLRHVGSDANQKYVGKTLAEIGEMRGVSPLDAMIDLSVEERLDAHFIAESMGHNQDEHVGGLLRHPRVHIGASDGGAHILSFSTYGDTGYLFGHFVRDQKLLTLEEAVKKVTSDTAAIWGIPDRGLLQTGLVADIVVFDPATIDRGVENYVQDVPGDGSRYVRDAHGVDTVIVAGGVAWSAAEGYTSDARGVILPPALSTTLPSGPERLAA
jgi:N-acyl-D-aspartate/D-glutamate deacylase